MVGVKKLRDSPRTTHGLDRCGECVQRGTFAESKKKEIED